MAIILNTPLQGAWHVKIIQTADNEKVIIPVPASIMKNGVGDIIAQANIKSLTNVIVRKTLARTEEVTADAAFAQEGGVNAYTESYWQTNNWWAAVSTIAANGFSASIEASVSGICLTFTGVVADGPGEVIISSK